MSTEDRDPATDGTGDSVSPPTGSESTDAAAEVEESRSSSSAPGTARTTRHLPLWQETGLLVIIAVVLAVVVKAFFVQAFYIPSESMEPGLVENDRILVQKVSYWFGGEPERGDVVVFEDPGGWLRGDEIQEPGNPLTSALAKIGLYPSGGHLVKRVIGVAGDVIKCCDDEGRISVNGVALDEDDYVLDEKNIPCRGPMTGSCNWTAGPVPDGHIFVMGDNRGHSADSTVHLCLPDETDCVPGDEFVPIDLVVGKVFLLLWPRDRFGFLDRPDTFADIPDAT